MSASTEAEQASEAALSQLYQCLDARTSFRLDAGAGAGKTYSLIKALHRLIEHNGRTLARQQQRVACITYTNVARAEIIQRTDRNPLVYCDTNHAFCWLLISPFQKQLRELVPSLPAWETKLLEAGADIGNRRIEYSLGRRAIREDEISLHHDDIIPLTAQLMSNEKFRQVVQATFPVILVDEYQDTDSTWTDAVRHHFLAATSPHVPLFGFFGDHWQKIYGNGCGELSDPAIVEIGKRANFRSAPVIVDCLNRMRPELPQAAQHTHLQGSITVLHTNSFAGTRQRGPHWGGDLPPAEAHAALRVTKERLDADGWDFTAGVTKILMLTHKVLAAEQGYSNLAGLFKYNDSFIKKENPYIAYFVDVLEPACESFLERRYGRMFECLGGATPLLRNHADKVRWNDALRRICQIREEGTVGDVLDAIRASRLIRLPEQVWRTEKLVDAGTGDEGEAPSSVVEARNLRAISYREITALRAFVEGHSPFDTKHGVKGAEFDNVLVVLGRGWNKYNFNEMLELASLGVPSSRSAAFEQNRNLFYVACSRARRRLALLFTQELSPNALRTLNDWFGVEPVDVLR